MSDIHCPITFTFSINNKNNEQVSNTEDAMTETDYFKIRCWDNEKKDDFIQNLEQIYTSSGLKNSENSENSGKDTVQCLTDKITTVLTDAAA